MKWIDRLLQVAKGASDLVLAGVVAAILAAMIVPLPEWLLDLGIALNLAASAALLVAALYAKDALQVASFPTLLLLTTLFRLALNVSTTRLALSEGRAGEIIQAFGEFVIRGDYAVGAVIFVILSLVQFLVVAKGAERVAEVSARFTLDAMPGKQMSIDADLRAGAIDQAQARGRRRELERESQLFGAMDGAMKFVKGDVIAGLVIVLVNLIGGTVMGVLHQQLTLSEAASSYALIAIGDGLVSQLPSLCIAIAAGLVVTRVGAEHAESTLAKEIGVQFFGQWRALWVIGALCLALSAVPGMPHLMFVLIAAASIGAGSWLRRTAARATPVGAVAPSRGLLPRPEPEVGVCALTLDLSADLEGLSREDGRGRPLTEALQGAREQLFQELGVRIPGIRVRTGVSYLPPGHYAVLLDEIPCGKGRVAPTGLYALTAPEELHVLEAEATAAVNPADGKTISLVLDLAKARLEAAGVGLLTPQQLLCQHLVGLMRRRAALLLGVQEVQRLLEDFEPQAPGLVKEALQKVPLPLLTEVLRRLLDEEVSIRNLRALLDALVSPFAEGDVCALAERCRQALQRYLTHKYAAGGPLYAFLVDPSVEQALRAGGSRGAVEPEKVGAILEGVGRIADQGRAVLLASPDVRRSLRKLCEGAFPEVAILTYAELEPALEIRPIGRLGPA